MASDIGPILGVIVALIVIITSVVLALRHSARSTSDDRTQVERLDAAMAAIAARTGLRHLPGAVYEHPVAGLIRAYGRLEGTLEGVEIRVVVERNGTFERYVDELRIEAARDPSRAPTDEALAGLRALGLELRLTPDRLVVVPHLGRAGAVSTQVYDFPVDAETLEAYLRATVSSLSRFA